ncbi:MAG: bifunctional DNA primase/polymerase [Myxococcales bacterium]
MNMVEHALAYLEAGVSLFPVDQARKPLVCWTRWQREHPCKAQVARWFRRWPWAGIAIVCGEISGLFVLDIEVYALWILDQVTLPKTPTVETRSGGRHLYYKHDRALRSTVWHHEGKRIGEFRSGGNYVIAPPSRVVGGAYRWLVHPLDAELVPAPEWVFESLMAVSAVCRSFPRTADAGLPAAAHASRSEADQSLALRMVLTGSPAFEIEAVLYARPACRDRGRHGEAYVQRTVSKAIAFANQHYHAARVASVRDGRGAIEINFLVLEGAHAGRMLKRRLDSTMTERAADVWESLLALGCEPQRLRHLVGLEVRIGLFDSPYGGVAVRGPVYPLVGALQRPSEGESL